MFHRRFLTAVAGALALTVGLSGTVLADTTTGTIGHYAITDTHDTPDGVCRYYLANDGITYYLYRIAIKPPSVWWPDRNSTSSTEHGTVGWRVILQVPAPTTGWMFFKRSTIQYATAYEDHPLYDSADKAPFTKIAMNVNGAAIPSGSAIRAFIKIFWYRRDGTVLGTATHMVGWFSVRYGSLTPVTYADYCWPAHTND